MKRHKRLAYLALCYALFFVILPLVVFYGTGYRIGKDFSVFRTGGMYIHSEQNNSKITINGQKIRTLSTFDRGFFIQDLKPQIYDVEVSKKGYKTWGKKIWIEKGIVTENSSLLLPEEILFIEIASTTSKGLESSKYKDIMELFLEKEEDVVEGEETFPRASKENPVSSGGVNVWKREDGKIIATWNTSSTKRAPYFFCVYNECEKEFEFFSSLLPIGYVDFYPDRSDTIIVTLPTGLYAVGLDRTPPQFFQPIYESSGVEFRVQSGEIYIKDGDIIGTIDLS